MASVGSKRPRYGSDSSTVSSAYERRVCPFCSKGHVEGLEFSSGFVDILTDSTVWATDEPTFVANGKPYWVHYVCAHFCPCTCYDEATEAWRYVSQEYHRARCLTCAICNQRGASIGCRVSTCKVSCHFPCAIQEIAPETGRKNWYPCQDPSTPFFCLAHRAESAQYDMCMEITRLADLSQGRETVAIPLNIGVTDAGTDAAFGGGRSSSAEIVSASARAHWRLLQEDVPLPRGIRLRAGENDFVYVQATVDSKSAEVRQGPEREKRCCSCAGPGACRDPRTCECLGDGRNYRWKGRRLDEGHPPLIFECNLNCSCSLYGCRNRLVQAGMRCKIDVSYLKAPPGLREGCDENWGVRAAEDIDAGTFVCTVAGQLVAASDVEGGVDEAGEHASGLVHRVQAWAPNSIRAGDDEFASETGATTDGALYLDQRRYANISRYIRSSTRQAEVNLVRVPVHTSHQDLKAPVVALFTTRHVAAGTELLVGPPSAGHHTTALQHLPSKQ